MAELLALGKDLKGLTATFGTNGTVKLSGDGYKPELRLTAAEVAEALKAWTPVTPPPTPPPTPPENTPTFGNFSAAFPPPQGWVPYITSSPWNQKPSGAVLSNSEQMCSFVASGKEVENVSTGGGKSSSYGAGFTVFYYASESDPIVTLHVTEDGHQLTGTQIRCPSVAKPCPDGDGHMTVVQVDGLAYDFWQTVPDIAGGLLNASGAGVSNIATGEGLCTVGDACAAGSGLFAGTIRVQELIAGHIPHVCAASIWETRTGKPIAPFANPAQGDGTSSNVNAPYEGQLFRLNMTETEILALKAGSAQTTILTALADYGFVATDSGGDGIGLKVEGAVGYTSFGLPNPLKQWCETTTNTGGELWEGEYVFHLNSLVDWSAKLEALA